MVIFLLLSTALMPVLNKSLKQQTHKLVPSDYGSRSKNITIEKDPWEVNKDLNASFFQGDIVLSARLKKIIFKSSSRPNRAIKKDPSSRWLNSNVPYSFDRRLSHNAKNEIRKAIKHWKRHTCIKFHKKQSSDKDFIHFVAEDGCWSSVGRQGGKQKIGVGHGCEYFGTIIHEIGHAMGMWHEQSRSDRDLYVKVVWNNIDPQYNDQFSQMAANIMDSMGYAYDYESIMHYGKNFFTKNQKNTLHIRQPGLNAGVRIGQRKRLSYLDLAQIRAMYNCNKIASPTKTGRCIKSKAGDGREYRGKLDYTEMGITCQPWDKRWPHVVKEKTGNYYKDYIKGLLHKKKVGATYSYHNHCRNPDGKHARPWCYTTLKKPKWQYCDIKIC